jgi:hypothetical protein
MGSSGAGARAWRRWRRRIGFPVARAVVRAAAWRRRDRPWPFVGARWGEIAVRLSMRRKRAKAECQGCGRQGGKAGNEEAVADHRKLRFQASAGLLEFREAGITRDRPHLSG